MITIQADIDVCLIVIIAVVVGILFVLRLFLLSLLWYQVCYFIDATIYFTTFTSGCYNYLNIICKSNGNALITMYSA